MTPAIPDGIAERGVAHPFVPAFDGLPTGEQRGATAGAIVDQVEEIAPFPVPNRREAPVLEDQEIGVFAVREHGASRGHPARQSDAGSP